MRPEYKSLLYPVSVSFSNSTSRTTSRVLHGAKVAVTSLDTSRNQVERQQQVAGGSSPVSFYAEMLTIPVPATPPQHKVEVKAAGDPIACSRINSLMAAGLPGCPNKYVD
jgi:hypothetical protein